MARANDKAGGKMNRRRRYSARLANQGNSRETPFRHNFRMQFPPAQQKALDLLARLLIYREDFHDEHFPLYRGSHILAHLQAAALDLQSVARSLADVATFLDDAISARDLKEAALTDQFALKTARLAKKLQAAIEAASPRRTRRTPPE